MRVKSVEFHEEADAEYERAFDWYFARSEPAAFDFVREVDRAIDTIVQAPERWPSDASGTRKYLLRRFPFALIYRELSSKIEILAVAHGHRRPGYWRDRF